MQTSVTSGELLSSLREVCARTHSQTLSPQAQLLVQCVPWHVGCDGFARDEHGCGDASNGFSASGGCQRHSVHIRGTLWQWFRSGVMVGPKGKLFGTLDETTKPNDLEAGVLRPPRQWIT